MTTTTGRVREDQPVAGTAAARTSILTPTRTWAAIGVWLFALWWAIPQVVRLFGGLYAGDAHIYWAVWQQSPMYRLAPDVPGAWIYPPIVADVLRPFTLLPWPLFAALWTLAAAATYLWLVRPLRWVWAVPLLALALEDVRAGNCVWLLALATVLGVRRSAWWLVPALVKLGPGVGVLWFAGRREWRALAVTAMLGAVLVGASVALHPGLWLEWLGFMRANGSGLALVRLALGGALAAWAGRTSRPWLLPVAMVLASPLIASWTWAILCAIPRLLPDETVARINARP